MTLYLNALVVERKFRHSRRGRGRKNKGKKEMMIKQTSLVIEWVSNVWCDFFHTKNWSEQKRDHWECGKCGKRWSPNSDIKEDNLSDK